MTSGLDDLAHVLADVHARATAMPSLDFHTGQIIAWNGNNQTNQVLVLGTLMTNLPVLTSANTTGLVAGAAVGVLRVRTQYFILGRVVDQTSGLVNPQFPIVMYPQFVSNTGGYWTVPVGTLATWEGRIKVAFPYIEVDGVWGNAGGTGSVTYAIKLGGTTVGTWTETTLTVARRGPYNITSFTGQDWLKVELAITASTGTGDKANQLLACYFRDS